MAGTSAKPNPATRLNAQFALAAKAEAIKPGTTDRSLGPSVAQKSAHPSEAGHHPSKNPYLLWGSLAALVVIVISIALLLLNRSKSSRLASERQVGSVSTAPNGPPSFAFKGAYVTYRISLGNHATTVTLKVTDVDAATDSMNVHSSGGPPPYDFSSESKSSLSHPSPNFLAFGVLDLAHLKQVSVAQDEGAPPATINHHVAVLLPRGEVATEEIHYPDGIAWVDDSSGLVVKMIGTDVLDEARMSFHWEETGQPILELVDTNIPLQP